ncbi:hypothetical protein H5410_021998 [Solanum commersonii]|uniref:Uncharacterized protein n=1 Tax=Solanum commersonii TaxID=4109 RepID=A0A9J5ZE52_SOLCO|nr:hypothetical protein H5410_021998 [Solanum commersonii]
MKGLPVNVGAISRLNFGLISDGASVGSIITSYLCALQIEEEVHDMCPPAPHLVYCLVDVNRTKTLILPKGRC